MEKNKDLELHITQEKGRFRQQVSGLHRGQPESQGGNRGRDKSCSAIGKLPEENQYLPDIYTGLEPALSPWEQCPFLGTWQS